MKTLFLSLLACVCLTACNEDTAKPGAITTNEVLSLRPVQGNTLPALSNFDGPTKTAQAPQAYHRMQLKPLTREQMLGAKG